MIRWRKSGVLLYHNNEIGWFIEKDIVHSRVEDQDFFVISSSQAIIAIKSEKIQGDFYRKNRHLITSSYHDFNIQKPKFL